MKTHALNFATVGVSILCNPKQDLWSVEHNDIRPTCKHCRRMVKEYNAFMRKTLREWEKKP